ncbi:MAG: hypothetical protein J2P47_08335 [Acetobacteraceae bacterium]|nr:hypothetical protein [Acetobacteraceae bacterium]
MNRPRLAATVLAATLLPALAIAQVNPFKTRWGAGRLRREDIRLLMDSSQRLLAGPTLAEGQSENWNNPRTGASGSVTVERTFHRQGALCHTFAYAASVHANAVPRKGRLDWCKIGDTWRIVS